MGDYRTSELERRVPLIVSTDTCCGCVGWTCNHRQAETQRAATILVLAGELDLVACAAGQCEAALRALAGEWRRLVQEEAL